MVIAIKYAVFIQIFPPIGEKNGAGIQNHPTNGKVDLGMLISDPEAGRLVLI